MVRAGCDDAFIVGASTVDLITLFGHKTMISGQNDGG
jgi:hypothetical protein